jgi:nucleotide-binding universal stress UspA family protein
MDYKSLLVHLEAGQANAAVLRTAADLAARFDARVIGIAACQPTQVLYNDGYVLGDLIAAEQADMEASLKAAEAEFRAAFPGGSHKAAWRSTITFQALHEVVAEEARSCDLVITGAMPGRALQSWTRHANNGDLVMQLGRPVLIVPPSADAFNLDHALIGWKDARETRRAVADALPLLRHATQVTVVAIAAEVKAAKMQVDDVGAWLKWHGITAECLSLAATGDDSKQLQLIAGERHASLFVAGAYGHSRLREWALGGVTRDLLLRPDRCVLLSH